MNDAFESFKTVVLILIGIIVGILGYLGKRTSERVDELKETAASREELTAALDRLEARQQDQHRENRALLERIENKIDENEERASKTRHSTKDEVHALALKLAQISKSGGP